jgi:hypothetical protein
MIIVDFFAHPNSSYKTTQACVLVDEEIKTRKKGKGGVAFFVLIQRRQQ